MTANRTLAQLPLAMMGLPIILGAFLCYLRPGGVWLWVTAMFFLPITWLGMKATSKGTTVGPTWMQLEYTGDTRRTISLAILFASLVISLPLGAKLANALGLINQSLADVVATRWTNVLAGGYFVFRGNRLPKILTPLLETTCDPATLQALQRCTGWAYVLAGFGLIVVWLLFPMHVAEPTGIVIILAGILTPTLILRTYAKRRIALLNH